MSKQKKQQGEGGQFFELEKGINLAAEGEAGKYFSPENVEKFRQLNERTQINISCILGDAFRRVGDSRVAAKLYFWHDGRVLEETGRIASGIGRGIEQLEERAAQYSQRPGQIDQDLLKFKEMADKQDIEIDSAVLEKVEKEKEAYLERLKASQQELKDAEAARDRQDKIRDTYEERKAAATERICEKWDRKVEGNNREIQKKEESLKKIGEGLAEIDKNRKKIEAGLREMESLSEQAVSKTVLDELKKSQKILQNRLYDVEQKYQKYSEKKSRIEFSISKLKTKNENHKRNIEKYRGPEIKYDELKDEEKEEVVNILKEMKKCLLKGEKTHSFGGIRVDFEDETAKMGYKWRPRARKSNIFWKKFAERFFPRALKIYGIRKFIQSKK